MKSRYSAYVYKDVKYIVKTTHKKNIDYKQDTKLWESELLKFCNQSEFMGLDIINYNNKEVISYVEFYVKIYINGKDNSFKERSEFIKEDGKWLYHSALVIK
jgi:SEC-C motif-containing protein